MALLTALAIGAPAAARDDVLHLSIKDLLASPNAKAKLDGSVKFLLAGEKTPNPLKTFATVPFSGLYREMETTFGANTERPSADKVERPPSAPR